MIVNLVIISVIMSLLTISVTVSLVIIFVGCDDCESGNNECEFCNNMFNGYDYELVILYMMGVNVSLVITYVIVSLLVTFVVK